MVVVSKDIGRPLVGISHLLTVLGHLLLGLAACDSSKRFDNELQYRCHRWRNVAFDNLVLCSSEE